MTTVILIPKLNAILVIYPICDFLGKITIIREQPGKKDENTIPNTGRKILFGAKRISKIVIATKELTNINSLSK